MYAIYLNGNLMNEFEGFEEAEKYGYSLTDLGNVIIKLSTN